MEDRFGYSGFSALKDILSILAGVGVVLLPLVYSRGLAVLANELVGCVVLSFFLLLGIVLIVRKCFICFSVSSLKVQISTIDVFVILCMAYYVFNVAVVDRWRIDRYTLIICGAAVVGYWLLRLRKVTLNILLYACCVSGIIQTVLAACQRLGIMVSHNMQFDVTGSFGNPGQLGGYVAICCVFSLGLLLHSIKGLNRLVMCLLGLAVSVQLYGLFLADSRAAWVAFLLGGFSLSIFYFPILAYCRKHKKFVLLFLCFGVVIGGIAAYKYRPSSAKARLLIWRVSADMVADAPLLGHGASSFAREYMLYQAAYFRKTPCSSFTMVADNSVYPFNELVGVMVRFGILGLVLMLLLFYSALIGKSEDSKSKILKSGLLALFSFSLFSYPTQIFPLLMFYPILLGSVRGKVIYVVSLPLWTLLPAIIITVVLLQQTIREGIFIKKISNTLLELYQKGDDLEEEEYIRMKDNISFNDYYQTWLMRQVETGKMGNERIEEMQPSCEGYCALAQYYMLHNKNLEAEKFLYLASDMIPTRIQPKYFLWELYIALGNGCKAMEMANEILRMPLKVENSYTLKVKRKVGNYIRK